MQRTTLVMTLLGAAACLPPAEDAGQVDPTESGSAGDGAATTAAGDESSGGDGAPPPGDADLDATIEIEPNLSVVHMIRTSDGILVALAGDTGGPGSYYSEVRAYSSSLELSWSQQFPGALISDLEDLGGGEYLAAGSAGMELAATLWRLSCCSESASQAYLQGTPNVWVVGADRLGDGIFLAVGGQDQTALLHVPLELGTATDLGTEHQWVYQTASTPAGTVVLRVDAGDFDGLDEIGLDGPMGGFAIDPGSALVGKGDELTLMSFDEDRVEIQAFGEEGDAWVTMPTPGFAAYYDDYVVDRHERVVLIHREEEPDGSASATLVEFDDDGVVARTLRVPHLQYDGMTLDVVTVGEDHAIYLALTEQTPDADRVQYIHRIAPL